MAYAKGPRTMEVEDLLIHQLLANLYKRRVKRSRSEVFTFRIHLKTQATCIALHEFALEHESSLAELETWECSLIKV